MHAREPQLSTLELRAALTSAPALGDPRLLEGLIANLLDNAIRHNVPAGEVEIATGSREGRAYVFVANTGTDIPEAEIERLFQPFQRLNGPRTRHDDGAGLGLGLGLSIVRAIATAHGAQLIEIVFPAA